MRVAEKKEDLGAEVRITGGVSKGDRLRGSGTDTLLHCLSGSHWQSETDPRKFLSACGHYFLPPKYQSVQRIRDLRFPSVAVPSRRMVT